MKGLRFMCAAMAAFVAFAACQKSPVASEQAGYKSVVVKLDNVVTKAPASGIVEGSAVIENFQVFFADASGKLHKGLNPAGEATRHYFDLSNMDKLNEGFHYLSTEVNKVIVVANYFTAEDETLTTVDQIKALPLNIEDQQNPSYLAMIGEEAFPDTPTRIDETTHPRTEVYAVDVTVAPLVARIEVRKLGVEFGSHESGNTLFTAVEVKNVAFDNFYLTTDFTGALSGEPQGTNPDTKYNFNVAGWYLDKAVENPGKDNEAVILTPSENVCKYEQNYLAYHFFPNTAAADYKADGYPRLFLQVMTTNHVGAPSVLDPQQVMTKTFTDANGPIVFKPGNIYKIDLVFPDSLISTELRCADITVKSTPWFVYTPSTNW